MKKLVIIIGLIILVVGTTIFFIINNNKECNIQGKKFKNSYEKYNNKEIEYNNKKYKLQSLTIDEENPMVEISKEDIIKKLDSSTSIIIFISPKDYKSRELIKSLLEIAKSNNCETIYYYDIDKLNDNYKNNKDKDLYNSIIEKLGDNITKTFDDSEEKKLENSTIIFEKDKDIKDELVLLQDKIKGVYIGSKQEEKELNLKDETGKKYNLLTRAIREKRKVKILYYSYGKGENERVIDPAEMFLFQDGWYCAAFCEKKQDIRHFELKRIIKYELLAEKYE